jgi:uncharacterized linocin/CFP29 family protein
MPNNNLGREQVWTPDIWAEIDKAVAAEVGQIRVGQKVFSSTPYPSGQPVPNDQFNLAADRSPLQIPEGQTLPLIEISVEFSLTEGQVGNEATLRTGRSLARMAAKTVAYMEDLIFFQGNAAQRPANWLGQVTVVNANSAGAGLLGNRLNPPIPVNTADPDYPALIFGAVVQGMGVLTNAGQPGPYALLLESSIFADTYQPVGGSLVTVADRIHPLVPGGFYGTGTLLVPPAPAAAGAAAAGAAGGQRNGLLVSLGGEPITIYVGTDATTAFTQKDQQGNSRFRVFERVQLVARDQRALVVLQFN